jgi:hypothetical protein
MNTKRIACALFVAVMFNASLNAAVQADSTGLPGDNLNLQGVLELFKKSENPEDFEKALNAKENEINNLDLNKDNKTDYIRVIDHSKDESHALVLQVDVNEKETQDVAVIEVEKKGNEEAHVQIIGDEDLYGKNYIVEPAAEETVKSASSDEAKSKTTVVVNVYHWPSVRYIYRPAYVVWVSPWRWNYYPVWWSPWAPVFWPVYHKRVYHYHHFHHRVHTHRVVRAHAVYAPHRRTSVTVYQHRKASGAGKQVVEKRSSGQKAMKGAPKQGRKQQAQQGKSRANKPAKSGGRQGGGRQGGGKQGGGGGRRK